MCEIIDKLREIEEVYGGTIYLNRLNKDEYRIRFLKSMVPMMIYSQMTKLVKVNDLEVEMVRGYSITDCIEYFEMRFSPDTWAIMRLLGVRCCNDV